MNILNQVKRQKANFFEQDELVKRQTILSYIASGYKLRFYEYDEVFDIDKKTTFNSRQINLGLVGRDGRNAMTRHISDLASNVGNDEFSTNIISYTVESIFNLAEELKISENRQRRRKFFTALSNSNGQMLLLFIGILSSAKHCVNENIDLNHQYLTTVIQNADENKRKMSKLYIKFHNDEISEDYLYEELDQIYNSFKQRVLTINGINFDRTAEEKALVSLFEEKDIETYLSFLGDEIRFAITRQFKLF